MLRCRELSRLPKAPRFKSVRFRRQTPGTIEPALMGRTKEHVDQSHPAAMNKQKLPYFVHPAFRLSVYPMALLGEGPSQGNPPFDTWKDRLARISGVEEDNADMLRIPPMKLPNQRPGQYPISFHAIVPIKKTSPKKVVRNQLRKKLRTAINLIVIRGADVQDKNGDKQLVLKTNEVHSRGGEGWILHGWTYIFWPTLEIYRMPYQELIPIVRTALNNVYKKGMDLESKWEMGAIGRPTRASSTKNSNESKTRRASSKFAPSERVKKAKLPILENGRQSKPAGKPRAAKGLPDDEDVTGWLRRKAATLPDEKIPDAATDFDKLLERHSGEPTKERPTTKSKSKPKPNSSPPRRPSERRKTDYSKMLKPKPVILGPSNTNGNNGTK